MYVRCKIKKDLGYGTGIYKTPDLIAVKVPVFSMSKLARVDVSLGPEMKSTGEVLGVGETLEEALYKGFTAAGKKMSNDRGVVLATVNDQDKRRVLRNSKRHETCRIYFHGDRRNSITSKI